MFDEDALQPLSGLQHLVFCERRWALLHLEGQWQDNAFTVEGTALHETVDDGRAESRGALQILRSVPLRSLRLGLVGKSDVVELHAAAPGSPGAVPVPGHAGHWRLFPVEYKRGAAQDLGPYRVQLCAQALCLEETFGTAIEAGALYSGESRHRHEVVFDAALRQTTEAAAARLHGLAAAGRTPPPVYGKKCHSCSLFEPCQPRTEGRSARGYLARALARAVEEEP
jgi:CRISPR-associated exonuclease Cas4